MLQAVTTDIARIPGCSVVTTLEASLTHEAGLSCSPSGQVIFVDDASQEFEVFQRLLREVDAVLVIAPETDGILAERCQSVIDAGVDSWNCSPEAIKLCGDKLLLADHLRMHGLPTIPTKIVDLALLQKGARSLVTGDKSDTKHNPKGVSPLFEAKPFDFAESWDINSRPVVLKPRDGAGSSLTFLIQNSLEWDDAARQFRDQGLAEKCLVQPFVSGKALSIGVNISLDGKCVDCMPVGEQRLSNDGRFRYMGGKIPADIPIPVTEAIQNMVRTIGETIPGLIGYVGIDFLLTDQGDPLIVEINPRLTTAYVGYRRLYDDALPQRWLQAMSSASLMVRQAGFIEFDPSEMLNSI